MLNIALYWGQKEYHFQKYPFLPKPSNQLPSRTHAEAQAISNHKKFGNEITYYWFAPFWTLAWFLQAGKLGTLGGFADFQETNVRPDIIVVVDLPHKCSEIRRLKDQYPDAKYILIVAESPLERHAQHDARNFAIFNAVLTYNRDVKPCGNKVFYYNLPFRFYSQASQASADKRLLRASLRHNSCIYIGKPHASGMWRNYQYSLGWRGMPVFWQYLMGWKLPLSAAVNDEIYSGYLARWPALAAADRVFKSRFSIYGGDWSNPNIGWTRKLPLPNLGPRFRSESLGMGMGSKYAIASMARFTLVCENYLGNKWYLSEKLFDAIAAGSIPIYIGAPGSVPESLREAVIDLSDQIVSPFNLFSQQLMAKLKSAQSASDDETNHRQQVCTAWMNGDGLKQYGVDQFLHAFVNALSAV